MNTLDELKHRLEHWHATEHARELDEARRVVQQQRARRRAIDHRGSPDAHAMVHLYYEAKRRLRNTRHALADARRAIAEIQADIRRHENTAGGRAGTIHWARRLVGRHESPSNSNCTSFLDLNFGIRCCAWCGKFCGNALVHGGHLNANEVASVGILGVASIEDHAKRAAGIFTGWSWDHRRARMGDLVVIGGYGVHVELAVAVVSGGLKNIGGNTSAANGSISNGGEVAEKFRPERVIRGIAHVDF